MSSRPRFRPWFAESAGPLPIPIFIGGVRLDAEFITAVLEGMKLIAARDAFIEEEVQRILQHIFDDFNGLGPLRPL